MTLPKENRNQLVVEGPDDKWSVINLMEAHLEWVKDSEPVWIDDANGRGKILKSGLLEAALKAQNTRALGVMLDAEDDPAGKTYQQVRRLCSKWFPRLPDELAPSGLIASNDEAKRLGIWIMPDNQTPGTLETFLRDLVPSSDPIWTHATESVIRARELGANFRPAHTEKANLRTWLAWQDEPGYPPGTALTKRILDPHNENATPFVTWFRALYEL